MNEIIYPMWQVVRALCASVLFASLILFLVKLMVYLEEKRYEKRRIEKQMRGDYE